MMKVVPVVTERILRSLNVSRATWVIALSISKGFDWVWQNGILHKLKTYGVPGYIFQIISSFLSGQRFCVFFDGRSSPEFAITAVSQGSLVGQTLFLLSISDLPDVVLLKIATYVDNTTPYFDFENVSHMWKQLDMPLDLQSEFRDTVMG